MSSLHSPIPAAAKKQGGDPSMIDNGTLVFQELYIVMSYLCNAECAHCYVSSGPRADRTKLDNRFVFKAIEESLEIDSLVPKIAIAGGEPTLFWDDLLATIKHAAGNKLQVVLVTNGWWGQPKETCRKKLDELVDCGLGHLELSTTVYHREFISPSSLNNIIELSEDRPIEISMHCRTNQSCDQESNVSFFDNRDRIKIVNIPIMPIGRAADRINKSEFIWEHGFPRGNCQNDLSLLINPNGNCYPCCGGSELNDYLLLGNIKNESLSQIISRAGRRRLLHILTNRGPSYIADILTSNGFDRLAENSYVGICDLCSTIFNSRKMSIAVERWVNSPNCKRRFSSDRVSSASNVTGEPRDVGGAVNVILRKKIKDQQCQPSGAILYSWGDYYLKTMPTPYAKRLVAQSEWLEYAWKHGVRCIPEILLTFENKNGFTGYVMPRYHNILPEINSDPINMSQHILDCLEHVWSIPPLGSQEIDLEGYMLRVHRILRNYDSDLSGRLARTGRRIGDMIGGRKSCTVHGDPTFENVVFDHDGEIILLDPNQQPHPGIAIPELDCAKVMQSAFGWEDFIYGRSPGLYWNRDLYPFVLSRFGKNGWFICGMILITHLVRTLPYGAKVNDPRLLLPTIENFLEQLDDDMRNLS